MAYKFEWDPEKAKSNKRKHHVAFEEAKTVFEDENAIIDYDELHSDDEDRFIIIGIDLIYNILNVCFCYRDNNNVIRIISARRANKKEQDDYFGRFL